MARFSRSGSKRRFYQQPTKSQTAVTDDSPFEVQIDRLSHDGRGLAKRSGKTLFVDGALPGERVQARYNQRKSKFDQAVTLQVIEPSPERVEPDCPHYQHCGGCQLQHLHSEAQILAKQQQALDQLRRIGGVEPEQQLEPLDGPHWHYRRRARLGIFKPKGNNPLSLGFRRGQSNKLTPISQCAVLAPRANQLIESLNLLLNELQQPLAISHLELCLGDSELALVIRHPRPLLETDQQALSQLCQEQHWQLYLQPAGIDSLHRLDGKSELASLSYRLPSKGDDTELQLAFAPGDFTQINADINRNMVQLAMELLAPEPQDRILDLFCGLGNFTLALARRAGEVVGVEAVEAMVQRGRANADRNGCSNASFHAADLTQPIQHLPWYGQGFNKVLLDPPRAGAAELIEPLCRLQPEQILYISCDPATLARDAGLLAKQGYQLQRWGVMNMFPHTTHVESIALFHR
ncbi:23S rRNA (uracil(1939)-C(5))-methyltransferase RlmD [Motiliproteus coralliicola]|uniref:23S rRNA (uracil(1939)-C(5))-methyltransferase RlmD n=1 Tax=Motiliproteus coralliicola TaxID=2283196 RepID=A0A369WX36_9GAMM|nr:23S rRNA (uracil(1939)-C(5))-methyltransferase RlmD [Motiliproteus coralliicola]RDE25094.1 23S rRNA (uracil(1939)-C(5))-methyltransferase RlmD [Motiliproteus coralliicola]